MPSECAGVLGTMRRPSARDAPFRMMQVSQRNCSIVSLSIRRFMTVALASREDASASSSRPLLSCVPQQRRWRVKMRVACENRRARERAHTSPTDMANTSTLSQPGPSTCSGETYSGDLRRSLRSLAASAQFDRRGAPRACAPPLLCPQSCPLSCHRCASERASRTGPCPFSSRVPTQSPPPAPPVSA